MSGPNDPKMREREGKNAITVAMGMKMSHVSTECWRNQVRKETQIHDDWKKVYQPDWLEKEREIIARVQAREAAKKSAAPPPERSLLYDGVSKDGKGRGAYLKLRHLREPKDKFSFPVTEAQEVGWSLQNVVPPPRSVAFNNGRKPVIKNGFYRYTIGGRLSDTVY